MEGGNLTGSEECGIGSIVWVRRRNGSWWPGKILGPDELSATHLMSPRSGTPVKLLGRQDASVDWYNLEKSKRVKAFRCGEFDDCIERAESSLGMPPKKREKYARREDAILHALELEREMLENQGDKLSIPQNFKSSSSLPSLKSRSVTPSGNLKFSGKHGNSGLEELPTGVDSYPKDLNGNNLHLPQQKEGKELYTDGNVSGISIPMITGTSGSEQRIANDSAIVGYSNGVVSFIESSDRGSMSSELLIGDTSVTRPDRRHHLAEVMQNNAKSLAQHAMQAERPSGSVSMSGSDHVGNIYRTKRSRSTYQPVVSNDFIYDSASSPQPEMFPLQSGESYSGSMSEESTSGSTEDTESDSSETEDLETDSDEEMRILSGRRIRPAAHGLSEAQRRNLSNHVSDEVVLMEEPPAFHARYHDNANTAVSKWKMKGKRNTRHLTKSSVDVADARNFGGTVDETYLRLRGGNLGKRTSEQRLGFHHKSYDSYNGFDETDYIEKDGQTYMAGFDYRGHSTAKRACRGWNSHVGRDTSDWDEMAWEDQPSLFGYTDHSIEYFNPTPFSHGNFRGRPRTPLIEVDLKVQTSYPKERVPIVSLMSKLDGKAIIGHPIQIEALEDGSSEMILCRTADNGNEAHYSEGDATLPPVWRTARRTANYRVPRPDLSSALDDDESEDYLPLESKQTPNRLNTGCSGYGGSLTRRGIFHVPRPPGEKKPVGRPPKRVSMSSGKKTRTLSSFSTEHKFGARSKRDGDSYSLQGLIKSEAGPTTIACIPVKLVYSRLYEAVGRPPGSVVSNHEALVNMNTETG